MIKDVIMATWNVRTMIQPGRMQKITKREAVCNGKNRKT
jgi:hypothetical protein